MKAIAVIFSLALAIFLSGVQSVTFTIKNNCSYTIWPVTKTGCGNPQLSPTGFELSPGAAKTLDVPAGRSGRVFARTGCSTSGGKFSCNTADCGSGNVECSGAGTYEPASVVDITVDAKGGNDSYHISLIDGFNLPVALAPQGGSGGCQSTTCGANVNAVCPPELAVRGADGSVIACKSACQALKQPRYCCTGDFSSPEKCTPTGYSGIFKKQCPQAYSYVLDGRSTGTFTCSGGANYAITFCP